jgi:hypothetical protein
MTPVAVLAEARSRGLSLAAEGARLLYRGPKGALTAELRDRLEAVKPELLALLGTHARQTRVRDTWSAAFRRLLALARDSWPLGGFETLSRLRPNLARDVEGAEVGAEAAGRAYTEGRAWDAYTTALATWEALYVEAIRLLASLCHDCGADVTAAVVADDASRFCRRCLAGCRP